MGKMVVEWGERKGEEREISKTVEIQSDLINPTMKMIGFQSGFINRIMSHHSIAVDQMIFMLMKTSGNSVSHPYKRAKKLGRGNLKTRTKK